MTPPPRPAPPVSRRGFTFVELIIVVMMLGILAGVAAPRYQTALADTQLDTAAKRLAADLRHARSVAIATAADVVVTVDAAASAYASTALRDPQRPDITLSVSLATRGHGLRVSAAAFGAGSDLTFDFRGEPDNAGSVTLANDSRTVTVSVDAAGRVEVTP